MSDENEKPVTGPEPEQAVPGPPRIFRANTGFEERRRRNAGLPIDDPSEKKDDGGMANVPGKPLYVNGGENARLKSAPAGGDPVSQGKGSDVAGAPGVAKPASVPPVPRPADSGGAPPEDQEVRAPEGLPRNPRGDRFLG